MRKVYVLSAILLASLLSFTPQAPAQQVVLSKTVRNAVAAPPSDNDVAKAVVKALGALASHQASKPQPGDGLVEMFARAAARGVRDELIGSALEDIAPDSKAVERAAIRNLVILAFDGQLPRDRNRVLQELRRSAPQSADAVEVLEFLIRLIQAVDKER